MSLSSLRLKKHWLFDMDGTLTHAVHDFDAIRKQLALPEQKPILESLAELPPDQAAEKNKLLDEIEFEIAEQATAQPGSEALLLSLQQQGCSIGIVTRNGKEIAKATLKACGLNLFFNDTTIIGRECAAPKPEPDGVTLLLSRMDANPADAVMVGDYMFDLVAGRKAGTQSIHLDVSDRGQWPEWTDYRIESLNQLLTAIA